eukprot:CAMPEP_0198239220 /NCGR_PEP_ID=MMETSP1446-20131203/4692_1 /TAXON_ID=1461542 ORGANISM="Unidentified sp, Strain CCMP2111" /NCGR_SAMPLE_ID=MMETSP1446 /ASSEMBLY_ACC=CAM_ASM_001112 /LENGTH=98 /DNA_ID=CAMNT_0043921775 /DNA_START=227 /DNA_END=523 /DNA_ORIENTATION=-
MATAHGGANPSESRPKRRNVLGFLMLGGVATSLAQASKPIASATSPQELQERNQERRAEMRRKMAELRSKRNSEVAAEQSQSESSDASKSDTPLEFTL